MSAQARADTDNLCEHWTRWLQSESTDARRLNPGQSGHSFNRGASFQCETPQLIFRVLFGFERPSVAHRGALLEPSGPIAQLVRARA